MLLGSLVLGGFFFSTTTKNKNESELDEPELEGDPPRSEDDESSAS